MENDRFIEIIDSQIEECETLMKTGIAAVQAKDLYNHSTEIEKFIAMKFVHDISREIDALKRQKEQYKYFSNPPTLQFPDQTCGIVKNPYYEKEDKT